MKQHNSIKKLIYNLAGGVAIYSITAVALNWHLSTNPTNYEMWKALLIILPVILGASPTVIFMAFSLFHPD